MASFLELILEPKLQAYYRCQEIKSQWKILDLAERGPGIIEKLKISVTSIFVKNAL